jgi:hypothetical protein
MRPIQILAVTLGLGLGAGLGACGGGDSSPSDNGQITAESGGNQSATVGTSLLPYTVMVTDLQGAPKGGVTVLWAVVSGGGSIAASSTTDGSGMASAAATLGIVSGLQTVHASAPGYSGSPVTFTSTGVADQPTAVLLRTGNNQIGPVSDTLAAPLEVRVTDQHGNGVAGATVNWTVTSGGATLTAPSTTADPQGIAQVRVVMPATAGAVTVMAQVAGVTPTVSFSATAVQAFTVLGGGNNVPERYGSDLWVHGGYAYSGTWGFRGQSGNTVKIWQLGTTTGAPTLVNSITVANIGTVSDVEVSPDGNWLVFTAEGGSAAGIHVYELTNPANPTFRASLSVSTGLHTGALAVINNTLYAFTAKNPGSPALNIYDLSQAGSGTITPAGSYPIPPFYGIHDTFVRDGYAFVFAWDEGLYILDVGNGSHGGSPTTPMLVSHTGDRNAPLFGGQTHNGWWFHNPNTGEKRYLFIGEEGPGVVGSSSSGDIHVVDVSDLANPVEVASYRLNGAGAHNFWMDEPNQRLYAAFYNGGVVALDVSGVLSGNLASRELARLQPGGAGNTYVWGIMLAGGYLYVSDMVSGFWQLGLP